MTVVPRFLHQPSRWLAALTLSVVPTLLPAGAVVPPVAADSRPGATLNILVSPVEVAPADSGAFLAAVDRQTLHEGDVVRTGQGGMAVLTFFDGSESQLGADSQILIERANATPAPQIAFLQVSGVTVNHVVPMPPGGSFRTDTPSATGLVRGTSYIVRVGSSGSATGTQAGPGEPGVASSSDMTSVVLLTDRDGHVGRVDVAAMGWNQPTLKLASAGEAAAASAQANTRAQLDLPSLARLESAANARNDVKAGREAEQHARSLAVALAPGLAAASSVSEPGERPSRPRVSEAPVVALPVAVVSELEPGRKDNETPRYPDSAGLSGPPSPPTTIRVPVPAPYPAPVPTPASTPTRVAESPVPPPVSDGKSRAGSSRQGRSDDSGDRRQSTAPSTAPAPAPRPESSERQKPNKEADKPDKPSKPDKLEPSHDGEAHA